MKLIPWTLLAGGLIMAAPAFAQDSTDKPIPAVPPATAHSTTGTTNELPQSTPNLKRSASKEGYAHNTGNVANGPTAPNTSGTRPTASTPPHAQQNAQTNVVNGYGYQHGTANTGNSNEPNGILGENGARASSTMQSGQINR